MDYRKTAQEILDKVGGGKNIVSAAHCATRLRLVIADNSKADKTAIENVEGVKDLIRICTGADRRYLGREKCLSVRLFFRRRGHYDRQLSVRVSVVGLRI